MLNWKKLLLENFFFKIVKIFKKKIEKKNLKENFWKKKFKKIF